MAKRTRGPMAPHREREARKHGKIGRWGSSVTYDPRPRDGVARRYGPSGQAQEKRGGKWVTV